MCVSSFYCKLLTIRGVIYAYGPISDSMDKSKSDSTPLGSTPFLEMLNVIVCTHLSVFIRYYIAPTFKCDGEVISSHKIGKEWLTRVKSSCKQTYRNLYFCKVFENFIRDRIQYLSKGSNVGHAEVI